ncbi:hypothetical protein B6U71_03925, partial [Euryarchaeota archaeon ex4484_178]
MRKRDILMALLLFVVIGNSIFYIAILNPAGNGSKENYTLRGYHNPIRIESNSQLQQQADSEGWQGNGSAENPYVIQDYFIDATGYSYGIYIGNVSLHLTIENCTIENATLGSWNSGAIVFYSSSNVSIINDKLRKSNYGIYLNSSSSIVIRSSMIYENSMAGVCIDSSSGNIIYNNYFNNTENVLFRGESSNTWSTEPDYGPNIIHGPLIGGNYWAKPDGSGYSETGTTNSMGFVSAYTLSPGNVDEHPLSRGGAISGDITGCGYINRPGVYNITADFESDCKYGILIMANDVELRGNGHWVNKSSTNGYGDT